MSIVDVTTEVLSASWARGFRNGIAKAAALAKGEHFWLPFYEQRDVSAFGDDWPVYFVERWERNEIGETRFTGEARFYRSVEPKGAEDVA